MKTYFCQQRSRVVGKGGFLFSNRKERKVDSRQFMEKLAWHEKQYMENNIDFPCTVLSTVPYNNRGCTGFHVKVAWLYTNLGVVVDGQSCSSCWHIGHDNPSPPHPIGTVVPPHPIGTVVQLPDGYDFHTASVFVDHSHNELVDDTKVSPFDLKRVGAVSSTFLRYLIDHHYVPFSYQTKRKEK